MNTRRNGNDLRHSAHITRRCSRCGRDLEDSASREHGVGPVCRRKSNDLHAVQIPADMNTASALFLGLRADSFHDACEGFAGTKRLFVRRMRTLSARHDDMSAVTLVGADFRKIVDWIDYALSFNIAMSVRKDLIKIVDALGYVGLASVLRGDACMSPATLTVKDGLIKLSGKSCKPGYFAMKRALGNNVQTPRYRGDQSPYVASVADAAAFVDVAFRHWPFIDADRDVVLADAKKAAKKLPKQTAPVVNDRPVATWRRVNPGWFAMSTPWFGTGDEMRAMLDRFKALPRAERKYDPASRSWSFTDNHWDTVCGIVRERYTIYGS